MQLDPKEVEEIAKTLYIRSVKLLPPDIKRGFERLMANETDATGRAVLNTMVENIAVAEQAAEPAVPGHRHSRSTTSSSARTSSSTARR